MELEREGLVFREWGKGNFVREGSKETIVFMIWPNERNLTRGAYFSIYQGIKEECINANQNLITMGIQMFDSLEVIAQTIRNLGGVISPCLLEEKMWSKLRNVPLVVVDILPKNKKFPAILADNFGGAYKATKYLMSLGHRIIAFLSIMNNEGCEPPNYLIREEGYRKALEDNSKKLFPELIEKEQKTSTSARRRGYEGMKKLLSLSSPPTAVLMASDSLMKGVLSAIEEFKLEVPHDISIIGFGDFPEIRANYSLTTVRVDWKKMGKLAYQKIISLQEGKKVKPFISVIPTKLIKRASCGKRKYTKKRND